jgi:hypothetical protein
LECRHPCGWSTAQRSEHHGVSGLTILMPMAIVNRDSAHGQSVSQLSDHRHNCALTMGTAMHHSLKHTAFQPPCHAPIGGASTPPWSDHWNDSGLWLNHRLYSSLTPVQCSEYGVSWCNTAVGEQYSGQSTVCLGGAQRCSQSDHSRACSLTPVLCSAYSKYNT